MGEFVCEFLDIPFAWVGLAVFMGIISYIGDRRFISLLGIENSSLSDHVRREKLKVNGKNGYDYESVEERNERVMHGAIWFILKHMNIRDYRPIHFVIIMWPVVILAPIVIGGYHMFFVCYVH